MDTNFQPVISKNTRGHYRQHPLAFKRALVALSLEPGASVAHVAREHGVNANQVFSWRRLYQQGHLGVPAIVRDDGLLPVVLAPSAPAPNNVDAGGDADGAIEIDNSAAEGGKYAAVSRTGADTPLGVFDKTGLIGSSPTSPGYGAARSERIFPLFYSRPEAGLQVQFSSLWNLHDDGDRAPAP